MDAGAKDTKLNKCKPRPMEEYKKTLPFLAGSITKEWEHEARERLERRLAILVDRRYQRVKKEQTAQYELFLKEIGE